MKHRNYTTYTYGDHYVREFTEVVVEGEVVRTVDIETWTDNQDRVKNIRRVIYDKEEVYGD